MTSIGVLQIAIFFGLILICTKPLGAFMANLFEGRRTFLHPALRWLEVLTYKLIGVKEDVEQRWTQYTAALLSYQYLWLPADVPAAAGTGIPAVQSAALQCQQRAAGPGVQYGY